MVIYRFIKYSLNRIQVFAEKIQGKLYLQSNLLIKKSLILQIKKSKLEKEFDLLTNKEKLETKPEKVNDVSI